MLSTFVLRFVKEMTERSLYRAVHKVRQNSMEINHKRTRVNEHKKGSIRAMLYKSCQNKLYILQKNVNLSLTFVPLKECCFSTTRFIGFLRCIEILLDWGSYYRTIVSSLSVMSTHMFNVYTFDPTPTFTSPILH